MIMGIIALLLLSCHNNMITDNLSINFLNLDFGITPRTFPRQNFITVIIIIIIVIIYSLVDFSSRGIVYNLFFVIFTYLYRVILSVIALIVYYYVRIIYPVVNKESLSGREMD